MREWLIKLLGGITQESVGDLIERRVRDQFGAMRSDEVMYLRGQVEGLQSRNEALETIILKKFNIIVADSMTLPRPNDLQPITSRTQWPQLKRKLESKDVEDYWKKKNAQSEANLNA